ncbi:type 4a pilus biogenesis protein PilO [Poriferisphaera sp. WC338]|uniref:type 4a pilus biogenesis protein PilO n=1 Tax=Poriferisphaera sp. WC338 TaxID=3425129 RepID=UPI003D81395F
MRIEKDQVKTLIAAALLIIVFASLVWYPQQQTKVALQKEIDTAKETLGMNQNSESTLAARNNTVERLREKLSGAQQRVPGKDELADVLTGLTRALRQNHLQEQEVIAKPIESYAAYNVMPMVMDFEGSFPETFGVLKSIESMPRLIRLDQLVIGNVVGRENTRERLAIHLELSTFFSESGERGME